MRIGRRAARQVEPQESCQTQSEQIDDELNHMGSFAVAAESLQLGQPIRMSSSSSSSRPVAGLKRWGAHKFLVLAAVAASVTLLLVVGLGGCSAQIAAMTSVANTTMRDHRSIEQAQRHRILASGSELGELPARDRAIESATAFDDFAWTPTDGKLDQSHTTPAARRRPDEQFATRESLLALLSSSAPPLVGYHLSQLTRPSPQTAPVHPKSQQQVQHFQLAQVDTESAAPVPKSAESNSNGNNVRMATWSAQANRLEPDGASTAEKLPTPDRTKAGATFGAARQQNLTAAGDPDLMTAASIEAANDDRHHYNSNGLAHSQLALQLHLKLKPLALPQPPSIRDDVVKRHHPRPVVSPGTGGHSQTAESAQTVAAGDRPKSGVAIQSHFEAAGWQEAKRVLLLNSIAPPLVQAVHRRLERRHSLSPPPTSRSTDDSMARDEYNLPGWRGKSSLKPQEGREKQLVGVNENKPTSTSASPDDGTSTTAKTPTTSTTAPETTESKAALDPSPLSAVRAHDQQQPSQKEQQVSRLDSMYQIELGDLSIGLAAGQSQGPLGHTSESIPFTGSHEEEAHIQQMAAAMLPFVWPSFQLTRGQSLGKLRVRSLDSKQRQQSMPMTTAAASASAAATTPGPPSTFVTWPMKYQQLSRSDRAQTKVEGNSTSSSAPAAASEFKPTFVELEVDREPAKSDQARQPALVTGGEGVASTTARPFKSAPSGSAKSTTARPENGRSGRKRRKKTNGYLQQQRQRLDRQRQQLQMNKERAKKNTGPTLSLASAIASASTPFNSTSSSARPMESDHRPASIPASSAPSDSTRIASTQPLPRIKFNASPAPPTAAMVPHSVELALNETRAQIPKSLSKLIEQQLAAKFANSSSNLSMSGPKSEQQNLILLQEYFVARQSWNSSSSDSAKLMKPPSTSVSKVVRLQAQGRNATSEIAPQPSNNKPDRSDSTAAQRAETVAAGAAALEQSKPLNRTSQTTKTTSTIAELTPSATTTTTTTTTTGRPATEIEASELGSNKVLPDDDEPPTTSSSASMIATARPAQSSSTARPKIKLESKESDGATDESNLSKPWQNQIKLKKVGSSGSGSGSAGNNDNARNIKLFHFKRKPDMNKLPFYKKPLNYTELGWTADEIEREQRRLLELQQFSGQLSASGQLELGQDQPLTRPAHDQHKSADKEAVDEEDEIELQTGEDAANGSQSEATRGVDPGPGTSTSELLLLKRKRRARSQFDRLMAELQAAAGEQQNQTASSRVQPGGNEQRVVPVLRKKAESLVMKPMFFNVHQKRRQASAAVTEPPAQAVTSAPSQEDQRSSKNASSATDEMSRNKPIVRMRRKDNNGEHSSQLASEPEMMISQWRPTRPSWTPVDVASSSSSLMQHAAPPPSASPDGVLLVPSGLLTPSGTHPLPLLTSISPEQGSWKPASGGELQSVAGAVAANTDQGVADQQQQQPSGPAESKPQGLNGMRVPRLLMKPMRPAKYSLNGYIPKPSLVQLQSAPGGAPPASSPTQTNAAAGAGGLQQPASLASSGRNGSRPIRRNDQKAGRPQQPSAAATGKDLDSSTSNEIFSRRRGVERTTAPVTDETRPQPLVAALSASAQLEENKRKYFKQHQEANSFKSPTLTIQKANQIKAKLGLSASRNSLKPRPTSSSEHDSGSTSDANTRSQRRSAAAATGGGWSPLTMTNRAEDNPQRPTAQQIAAASTNRLSTLDPPRTDTTDDSEPLSGSGSGSHGQQVAGAGPFNSIPKTNFDCTNKRGQFVSGLFADVQTGCKVWHLCSNNRKYSFLCPTGTIFNSKVNSCDWKHSAKCGGDS